MSGLKFALALTIMCWAVVFTATPVLAKSNERYIYERDIIDLRKEYRNGDTLTVCLTKDPKIKGMKGVTIQDKHGKEVLVVSLSAKEHDADCKTVKRSQLPDRMRFLMWRIRYYLGADVITGVDVGYQGTMPLGYMQFHWVEEK